MSHQIIDRISTSNFSDGLPLEATVAATVDHPAVVKTLAQEIEVIPTEGKLGQQAQSTVCAWIVTEFCDKGTLAVRAPTSVLLLQNI